MKYTKLFEPIRIGKVKLKNRMVMPPMVTHFASKDGLVTERLEEYHVARAKGGVGMIIVEATYIHPEGKGGLNRLGIHINETTPGLRALVSAVHQAHSEECKIAIQLQHGGGQIAPEAIWQYPVSASTVPRIAWGVRSIPRTLNVKEIENLVEAYSDAAPRAKEAGFDAVQINAGHGYLVWSFLSPIANKRKDKYGGDLEGRMRFLLEIIEKTREKIYNIPIMVRINGDDYVDGGIKIDDAIAISKRLEEAGVDAINVSAGIRETHEYQDPPRAISDCCNVYLAAMIKKAVKIPVSVSGKIRTPEAAEKILEEGKADLVDIGRALICDPEWPLKALKERPEDIRPCVSCLRCVERLFSNLDLACTLNPTVGREGEEIKPAEKLKSVLVVGGGPAGLEAARGCALRGHKVTLYEKDVKLGGQLWLAALPPHKDQFEDVIKYYGTQLRRLNVKVELGKIVTLKTIEEIKPDVVIVATGSSPIIPVIPVIDSEKVFTAHEVLAGKARRVGQKVIVMGAGLVGAETADLLSDMGKEVTIVEGMKTVGFNLENSNGKLLIKRLCEKGVKILLNTRVQKIEKDQVICDRAGEREVLKMDTVILAVGVQPNKKFFEELKGKFSELYATGDCVEAREAFESIQEGYTIVCKI